MILLDTNIVLDVIQKRQPHYHASATVLDRIVRRAPRHVDIVDWPAPSLMALCRGLFFRPRKHNPRSRGRTGQSMMSTACVRHRLIYWGPCD